MSRYRPALRGPGAVLVLAALTAAGLEGAPPAAPAHRSASDSARASVTAGPRAFPGVYAFVDVHVVPMDRRRVLEHQTVLVRDGVIRAVADTGAIEVPENAVRIEGRGRYLMPGLGDMYVRLPGAEAPEGELEELLLLYVAHGVTTVRQATGRRGHRTLKVRLLRDQLLGPTLYVASPPFRSGAAVAADSVAADSVEAAVERFARERWDLLRVPEGMSLREWNWMTEAVVGFGLPFGGPVPDSVGLPRALATGISTVDRLDGFLEAVVDDTYRSRIEAAFAPRSAPDTAAADSLAGPASAATGPYAGGGPPLPPLDSLVRSVVPRKVWAVAGRARAAGAWMVPTLRIRELAVSPVDPDSLLSLPEMRYVPREARGAWVQRKEALPPTDSATARLLARTRRSAVKALNDLNAGLLVGTDSPNLFNVPGASIHREMRIMEEAGIIPYEILIAATRNVARYASTELGESGRFGTVAEGNRADLILVEGNPLEDLGALERRAGVMVRGRWLPRSEIRERLDAIAAQHGG